MDQVNPPPAARLKSIDFLRGCAAIAVVIAHSMVHRIPPVSITEPWFAPLRLFLIHGFLGVSLFFVISGFCIHLTWAKRFARTGEQQRDFGAFWKRRFQRLYPPYLVMLCVSMGLVVLVYYSGRHTSYTDIYPEPRFRWMALDFVAHLLMLHGLHPILDYAAGNEVYWTLSREEYLYLMYFAVLSWRCRSGMKRSLLFVSGLGLLLPWIVVWLTPRLAPHIAWWDIFAYSFNPRTSAIFLWIQWCLGMAAAEAYCGLITLPIWCRSPWAVVVWATLAIANDRIGTPFLYAILWGMTFFSLLNVCVARETAGRWQDRYVTKWLSQVGLFSYSLYLSHVPLFYVLVELLDYIPRLRPPVITGAYWMMGSLLMVLIAIVVGTVYFMLVERWFLYPPRAAPTPSPGENIEYKPQTQS